MDQLISEIITTLDDQELAACEAAASTVRKQYCASETNPLFMDQFNMHTNVSDGDDD